MNEAGLKNIINLPFLPKLMRLELCYNNIESGLETLTQYPLLRIVKMRYNQIKEFDVLKPLADCKLLNQLELFMCPVTELRNYRRTVFAILE